MRYTHTVLISKELVFEAKYYDCPRCHQRVQKHIYCEGARWHVHSYTERGVRCSEPDCEDNHGIGKCALARKSRSRNS